MALKMSELKLDISLLTPLSLLTFSHFCGAGGSRTRVRTKRRNAFYMLSF